MLSCSLLFQYFSQIEGPSLYSDLVRWSALVVQMRKIYINDRHVTFSNSSLVFLCSHRCLAMQRERETERRLHTDGIRRTNAERSVVCFSQER